MRIRVHLGDARDGWLRVIPSHDVFFSVSTAKPGHRPEMPTFIHAECPAFFMLTPGMRWLDVRSRGRFSLMLGHQVTERGVPGERVHRIGPVRQNSTVILPGQP